MRQRVLLEAPVRKKEPGCASPGIQRNETDFAGRVWRVLDTVIDPELGLPITDLGLIYEVEPGDDNSVSIEMTTTTPICPLGDFLACTVRDRLKTIENIDAEVSLTHTPPWSTDRLNDRARSALGIG